MRSISKNSTAILHFLPLEGYPPVQNLLKILSAKSQKYIFSFTTKGDFNFRYREEGAKIYRFGLSNYSGTGIFKRGFIYFSYLYYNLIGSFLLFVKRPGTILYYESISSFPAIIYKLFFPKTVIHIHYHEYTSLNEYASGPFLNRWLHNLEKKIYKKAKSISHTNEMRLKLFAQDNQMEDYEGLKVIPNYPLRSWFDKGGAKEPKKFSGKFVYVGYSLDFDSMYVKEIIDYIAIHPELSLDFYLFRTPDEIKTYADSLNGSNINWNPGVPYKELPFILQEYEIGLILYKGLTKNYEHNAPNKLFEYLSCGLDVWCSEEIKGVHPYLQENKNIKMIDFLNIKSSDYGRVKRGKTSTSYNAEQALEPLITDLIK